MVPNSLMTKAATVLTAGGVLLVLINWFLKPDSRLAWGAALAMLVVMAIALRYSYSAATRFAATHAEAARAHAQIATAVVFAGLMICVSLAVSLARAYGIADSIDIARRSNGVLISLFLAMLGNVMPKNLPPLSSGCDPVRQRAFHKLTGWTWVLCGLASAIGWIVLPIDAAQTTAVVLTVTAMGATIVHLVRLAGRARRSDS